MDYASLLNKNQLEAVETDSQFVRIIAGAGSGKTRVLTYRISYLIGEKGVDPRRILAIAFTNKVALEMKDRACKLLQNEGSFLRIFTFHAFCSRFLREEAESIGYKPGFTIYDEDDQASLVKKIAVDFGYKKGDSKIKEILHFIRNSKGKGLYPDDFSAKLKPSEEEAIKVYREYERQKEEMFALDFDDLLLKTIEILDADASIRLKWQRRFDHILVDEFQDTNDIQYKLMKLLSRDDTYLYVVGDPDQTIYTWRGANQKIILGFETDHPNVETIILNENYRSTKTILEAANKLIKNNKNRVPKDLFTNQNEGEKIETYQGAKSEDEADWVIRKIKEITKDDPDGYKNIAVLYRASYLTRALESKLAASRIPYRIFGGLRFYQRMEVKDVLAYFRLLTNELDNVAFDRIINVPKRKIGDASLDIIHKEAAAAGVSQYQYLRNIDPSSSELSSRVINSVQDLIIKMEKTKEKLKDNLEAYSSVLREFISDIGYFTYIADEESPNEDRLGNVNALFDDINSFISSHPESTFEEYLQNVALFTAQDDINDGNYVSLMTIHVAKGLEFDTVFIIGLNENVFPSQRTTMESGNNGMEEERRLAYVAITRARKKLYMTCNSGYSYQTDSSLSPSQFFKEAGVNLKRTESKSFWDDGYGWRYQKKERPSASFFADGDAISPFEDAHKDVPRIDEKPKTNGVKDWKVGDIAHHETFGDGVVTAVISETIIVINFDTCGKKTLLSTHALLSKKSSKGGTA